jgi:hypothetical protein
LFILKLKFPAVKIILVLLRNKELKRQQHIQSLVCDFSCVISARCIIEMILKTNKSTNLFFFSPEIDGDEFVAHMFVFLIAGFETAATTLSFALQELSLHPEIQNRLRAEIMQVLNKHNGQLTYHGIEEMAYRRWPTWTWLCQVRGQNNLHFILRIFDNAPMNSCILLGDFFLA